jgi:hypothetical protein
MGAIGQLGRHCAKSLPLILGIRDNGLHAGSSSWVLEIHVMVVVVVVVLLSCSGACLGAVGALLSVVGT